MPLHHEFAFPLAHGLHARPASVLAEAAGRHAAAVGLRNGRNGVCANAKSVLSLVATDLRRGDPAVLTVEGPDEAAALAALARFLRDVFPGCDAEVPAPPAAPGAGAAAPRAVRNANARFLAGTPVSPGIAAAPAFVPGAPAPPAGIPETAGDAGAELARFEAALAALDAALEARRPGAGGVERGVLRAHLAIARDPEFGEAVRRRIREERASAGRAVQALEQHYAALFESLESLLLRERALDVRDVAGQLLERMYGPAGAPPRGPAGPAVVIADALTPSQFLALDRRHLRGLALAHGGATSHTVILARAFGVPCVVGLRDATRAVAEGTPVILDANRGLLLPEPTAPVARFYALEARHDEARRARLDATAPGPGATADGRRLEIGANLSTAAEAAPAFAAGAEGVGLFRTEMLFLERAAPPSEEEQFAAYAAVVRAAAGRPVVVRTLDVGGDKPLPYLRLPEEENPFLGLRGVRWYGEHEGLLRTQLRAVLRASALGPVRLLLPMVTRIEELRRARTWVAAAQAELAAAGAPFDPALRIGVMVEVPAAAFAIAELSREADFFSVGSNDLAQYFFAADRGNARVAPLADPLQPAFLQLLRKIVEDAHARGRRVGLCGEMAGRPGLAPLLAGLGFDALSMAAPAIAPVKAALRAATAEEADRLREAALALARADEVAALLAERAAAQTGGALLHAELVDTDSDCRSREEAIKELAGRLHLAGRATDADAVEEAVWRREDHYSTGVGFGFAIPHCKSEAVTANSIGLLRLREPIEWQSLDGAPVRVVILLAIREAEQDEAHLRIFAKLARKVMNEEFRGRLFAETDVQAMMAYVNGELGL